MTAFTTDTAAAEPRSLPLRAAFLCLVPCAMAWIVAQNLIGEGLVVTGGSALEVFVSFHLFVAQDMPVALVAALAFALVAATRTPALPLGRLARAVPLMALAGAAGTLAIRLAVFHGYDMTLDEFMPRFQAEIFRAGLLMAPLDGAAFAQHKLLQPYFTYVSDTHQLWSSHYRPVHAALIAGAEALRLGALLNPVLVAVSVLAIARIARQVFPDRPEAPTMAAGLLLLSPQFLLTAGGNFAHVAHLAANLVWLTLFLDGRMRSHVAAAAVGFFAIGLHQVHVHPLFAAPFLLAMLFGAFGPRRHLLPYVVAYALALPLWVAWPEIAVFLQTGDAAALPRSLIEVDYIANYLRHTETHATTGRTFGTDFLAVNALRFALWVSPALLLLAAAALLRPRGLGRVPVLCGLGFLLMAGASHVLMPNQMQTWGARYEHPVLGNAVLFALGGYVAAARAGQGARLAGMATALALIGAVVFLPWRAVQVEAKVGPRAAVQAALAGLDAGTVAIRPEGQWFGADFVRNDPLLRSRPLMVFADAPPSPPLAAPGIVVDRAALTALGLPIGTVIEPGTPR